MASSPAPPKNQTDNKSSHHGQRNNKENKLPDDLLDWRQEKSSTTNNNTTTTPKKSNGIPPKKFHQGGSNRVRSRPGSDYVKKIHSKTKENLLKEEKREHSRTQEAKRSAYKCLTSLKTWPIQDLAMQDYQGLLKVYLNEETTTENKNRNKNKDNNESAENDETVQPDHEYGDSSSSCASASDRKRFMKDKNLSPSKSQLKVKCMDNFLRERDIPAHNVATSTCDPSKKFDPGLWSMEPRIFSIEKANGKRKYIVGQFGRVMDQLWRKTDKCNRHFYELILEKTPCRLYFDLEYSIPDNPGINNDKLLDEFYKELSTELFLQFPNHMEGFDRKCIVDLDSSTPKKFSRHWIIHLPSKALFKDSQQVGKFVKTFIQKLADDVATGILKDRCPCLQDHLFVNPKDTATKKKGDETAAAATTTKEAELPLSKKTCFVDIGVYTRNRLFRLLGSSKWGKSPDCALRFAESNQFPLPKGFGNEKFYVPAMVKSESESSSSDDSDDDDLDQRERENALEKFRTQTDWSLHAQVTGRTLIVPLNIPKIDYPLLPEIVDKSLENTKSIDQHFASASGGSNHNNHNKTYSRSAYLTTRPSYGSSPYPYLDDFVLDELAGRGGIQGSIRAWNLDYGQSNSRVPVAMSYHMSRNRFCERIGRFHKSNNILWTVNFTTRPAQCFQTCFDPECRSANFRSNPVDLPCEVMLQLEDALFEEEIARMDENEYLGGKTIPSSSSANPAKANDSNDEFENAMRDLNLSDGKTETKHSSQEDSFDNSLSDEALLEAINANPELFG